MSKYVGEEWVKDWEFDKLTEQVQKFKKKTGATSVVVTNGERASDWGYTQDVKIIGYK